MKPGSKGWKNLMAKMYGIGAAVVIVGALFKINHYPYASEMLIIGLGTEAIIFFFSAFEKPHESRTGRWFILNSLLLQMVHLQRKMSQANWMTCSKMPTSNLI